MTSPNLLSFSVLAVLLILTPGADTLLLVRNALSGGRRAAIATVLGSRLGLVVHALLAAIGLSALLATSAIAYRGLKIAGAGYLIWLGVRALLRAAQDRTDEDGSATNGLRPTGGNPWLEGLLTNLLNPKTALFYLAVLPQFIGPQHQVAARALVLATIHIGLSLVWYLGLAVAVDVARGLVSSGRARRMLDALGGAALMSIGGLLALDSR